MFDAALAVVAHPSQSTENRNAARIIEYALLPSMLRRRFRYRIL
jgi:hypothetical protein